MNRFNKAFSSKADALLSGTIRSQPSDFKVDEIASFEPSGTGEHVFIQIEKTGENTDWVAGLLAKIANVPKRDVSYAGMKDRNAITTQWFSVQMPGKEAPDWQQQLPESIKVLQQTRHNRKLRRGALKGNRFTLVIRDVKGDFEMANILCEKIKAKGVPNYYGEQRFGHDLYNLKSAENWFKAGFKLKSRSKRSIFLSAARSWIFNHILSQRVTEGNWNQAQAGDVFMLNGSQSCFANDDDPSLVERTQQQDIHPTGALWGKGELLTTGHIAILEQEIGNQFDNLTTGLIKYDLKQERRALRLPVNQFNVDFDADHLYLSFMLPAGSFATVVLRELGTFTTYKIESKR
ncbi:MAG: tRNA pseudouridine(13) synthase TruD [Cocleimonas sp.]|nr:tRNA pseudouridine(13) synthase TruD [Cocleimonas sp.]